MKARVIPASARKGWRLLRAKEPIKYGDVFDYGIASSIAGCPPVSGYLINLGSASGAAKEIEKNRLGQGGSAPIFPNFYRRSEKLKRRARK